MAEAYSVWDRLANNYDRLWVQKYSLAPTRLKVMEILSSLPENPEMLLLDLGCGTGQLLYELKNKYAGVKLSGVDKSSEMIRTAQAKKIGAELFCLNIDRDELPEKINENKPDVIVCCHSFPYYNDKQAVLNKLFNALKTDGILIFIQASVNNLYDRLIHSAVIRTAEPGEYLSIKAFRDLVSTKFVIKQEFKIKKRFYMPSICGFVLVKRL